jgi:hypothetical protein
VKRSESICVGAVLLYYFTGPLMLGFYIAGAPRAVLDIFPYISLFSIVLMCAFVGNLLLGDPSAREREAKRQILLESPHVLMPDKEYLQEQSEKDR